MKHLYFGILIVPLLFFSAKGIGKPAASSAIIPEGWKLVKSAGCGCEVAVPKDWQEGKDFSLECAKARVLEVRPGALVKICPSKNRGGFGVSRAKRGENLSNYEIRYATLDGNIFYSIVRTRTTVPFTNADKDSLKQVGSTLMVTK